MMLFKSLAKLSVLKRIQYPSTYYNSYLNVPRFYFAGNQQQPQRQQQKLRHQEDKNQQEDAEFKTKKNPLAILVAAGLGIFAGYMSIQDDNPVRKENFEVEKKEKEENQEQDKNSNESQLKNMIGGEWSLKDTKGKVVSSTTLKDNYYLIYFGFCNCPEICPNELKKLSKGLEILKKSGQVKNINLKTLFVSVDPDRDTPAKMEGFINMIDSSFIGLTGTNNEDKQLKDAMKQFRIYATKLEYEEIEDSRGKDSKGKLTSTYTIDHSIITYLMSDTNQYLANLGQNLSEQEIASTISQAILANEKAKKVKNQ